MNGSTCGLDYQLTSEDFERIRAVVARRTGIELTDAKKTLVYSRLVRRVRALKLRSFSRYCDHLESNPGEIQHAISAITTNFTSFFREQHHFATLAERVIPERVDNAPRGTIRVWSAGCSTGEEAYSAAMVLQSRLPAGWSYKVEGTDVSSRVVRLAQQGVYAEGGVHKIPVALRKRYLLKGKGSRVSMVRMTDSLRSHVRFEVGNLFASGGTNATYQVIFCRNVSIYFSGERRLQLFQRLSDRLCAGGYLFIGHSESLDPARHHLQALGQTTYRRMS